MSVDFDQKLISGLTQAVGQAGQAILDYYEGRKNAAVRVKQDGSPVTEADLAADDILCAALGTLMPGIPVVSEERFNGTFDLAHGHAFWLVDPLDGTREFVNRTGEFTVNIGLIEQQRPVFGMIGIPTAGEIYAGRVGQGAWRIGRDGIKRSIAARVQPAAGLTVTSSRSHGSQSALADFLADYPVSSHYRRGSSYKFCDIASAVADFYPCLNRIREWDTAAGHALVLAAGGRVTTLEGDELLYGNDGLRNPPFMAMGRE